MIGEIRQKLRERLLSAIPNTILRSIIFGSYVRGDETPNSDLDILIIVTNKSKKLEKQISDAAYEIMWEYDFTPLISLEITTEEHWQFLKNKGSSFYRNIQREGIPL